MNHLAYTTRGNPSHSAIMLVHGFMSCQHQWALNVDALSNHHHLVLVELWGHGDSPTPTRGSDYSLSAYIEQFEHIRRALGIEQWHLVGQSYGAGLVLNYAHRLPKHCLSLVATNSRSAFSRPADSTEPTTANAPKPPSLKGEFKHRDLPYHPIHARRFPERLKATMVEKADAMSRDAIRNSGKLGAKLNCVELVGDLKAPLLITNGRFEKSFQADLTYLLERYPHLDVAHLDGGHSVNIEAADNFNQAVLNFLGSATQ